VFGQTDMPFLGPSNRGEFHRKPNGLQTPCKHVTLRGWWGNPWGFESPLRDHREIERGVRRITALPVFVRAHAEGGTRTGERRPTPGRRSLPGIPSLSFDLSVTERVARKSAPLWSASVARPAGRPSARTHEAHRSSPPIGDSNPPIYQELDSEEERDFRSPFPGRRALPGFSPASTFPAGTVAGSVTRQSLALPGGLRRERVNSQTKIS